MEDQRDPHYTSFGKPQSARPRDPSVLLWTFRHNGVDWSCELVFRGESYGWEARVPRGADLVISQRLVLRAHAVEWTKAQHADAERGWIDRYINAIILLANPTRTGIILWMDAQGPRRVTFTFELAVGNSLQGSELRVCAFDGRPGRGANMTTTYHFDFGPSGDFGWRKGSPQSRGAAVIFTTREGELFTTSGLVDELAKKLIKAVTEHQRFKLGVGW